MEFIPYETRVAREHAETRAGARYFDDLAFLAPREREEAAEPEPLKKVRVLPPFSCSHKGERFLPGMVAEVPASVAAQWLKGRWVFDESPDVEVVSDDAGAQTRKRGRRPKPE